MIRIASAPQILEMSLHHREQLLVLDVPEGMVRLVLDEEPEVRQELAEPDVR